MLLIPLNLNPMVDCKKGVIAQQTQIKPTTNSSIPPLRKTKSIQRRIVPVKRDVIPVKLPAIIKKTSSKTLKRIPTTNNQQASLRSEIPSSNIKNPLILPSLVKPISVPQQLPLIKECTIKENLIQKATLRCKTPRPESAVSQSNIFIINEPAKEIKNDTALQNMDVGSLLSQSARHRLKRLFNKLDTDKDGHLIYSQVQRCLPPNLPRAQLTFFRVLYDIISGTTYFGLQEFYATAVVVEMIAKQDSMLWNTSLDDVDFNYYHDNIVTLLEEFNNLCSSGIGIISYENLLGLIMDRIINGKTERITTELEYILPKIRTMKINRLDFIAILPVIIYIESCFDHGQTLFRFRENSILELHIRQALVV